jgi:hypothetical protein
MLPLNGNLFVRGGICPGADHRDEWAENSKVKSKK